MPVNFLQLLQDSWNFIRNRSQFSLFAISLLVAIQLIMVFVLPNRLVATETTISMLFPTLLVAGGNVYISLLLILNIKSINAGEYRSFLQNGLIAFNKLWAAIGLYILMALPFSFGLSAALVGMMGGDGIKIVAIPLVIMGCFVFIKLCLSIYVYLIENYTFGQAVRFTWHFTKGKLYVMLGYCFIAHILPLILTTFISKLGNNIAIMIISLLVSAFLSLFTTIFGFRFYQAIRQ